MSPVISFPRIHWVKYWDGKGQSKYEGWVRGAAVGRQTHFCRESSYLQPWLFLLQCGYLSFAERLSHVPKAKEIQSPVCGTSRTDLGSSSLHLILSAPCLSSPHQPAAALIKWDFSCKDCFLIALAINSQWNFFMIVRLPQNTIDTAIGLWLGVLPPCTFIILWSSRMLQWLIRDTQVYSVLNGLKIS